MAASDDEVAARPEGVGVDLSELVRADALYPGRDPVADVGAMPRALPELAVRSARRGAELDELSRPRVPRPGLEVVEVVEAVVLVPDEPTAVEGAPRLGELGVG